jgi:hypothetical protein
MATQTVHRAPVGRGFLAACAALLGLAAPAMAGTIVQPQGTYFYEPKDVPNTFDTGIAIGETIRVPTDGDTSLVSFGISVAKPTNEPFSYQVMGELYAWNGTQATGPNLFQSLPVSNGFPKLDAPPFPIFDTGGIDLVAGQEYVIFMSLPAHVDFIYSYLIGGTGAGYPDGSTVRIDSDNPSDWTSQAWKVGEPTSSTPNFLPETNFIATFAAPQVTAAPEPSALLLLSLGSACVGVVRTVRVGRRKVTSRPRRAADTTSE